MPRAQLSHRVVGVGGRPGAVGHRRGPRVCRIIGVADRGRRNLRIRIGDLLNRVVESVGIRRHLSFRIGDRLEPTGGRVVRVGRGGSPVGPQLARHAPLHIAVPTRGAPIGIDQFAQTPTRTPFLRDDPAKQITGRHESPQRIVEVSRRSSDPVGARRHVQAIVGGRLRRPARIRHPRRPIECVVIGRRRVTVRIRDRAHAPVVVVRVGRHRAVHRRGDRPQTMIRVVCERSRLVLRVRHGQRLADTVVGVRR